MQTGNNLSTKLEAGNRTYFFDLQKTVDGNFYLKISELISKPNEADERHRLMVFEENFVGFMAALQNLLPINKVYNSYMEEQKALYPNAYKPWAAEDDQKLEQLFFDGKGIVELAQFFQRNKGAIISRMNKLEMLEKYYQTSPQTLLAG